MIAAKAVMDSLLKDAGDVEPLAELSRFRVDFHACLTARADELSELADAVLCADGPVRTLAGLSLAPEHRRGHGALYDAVNHGRVDTGRLGPGDDQTEVTAVQVREVVGRLVAAGHWREGDLRILVVFDAGYDVTRLAWLLADLPVELPGRLRSDRVMWLPAPPRRPGTNGRPRKHGRELALSSPAACPDPQVTTSTVTSRYGMARAAAWDRVHPRLTHRAAWLDHDGPLPVIEGTLIRLQVDYLPGDRDPKPVWLWWSRTGATPADVDRCWQSFLRRFDLEHTFRLFKQVLGWTAPKIRDPAAADRWTWLIIASRARSWASAGRPIARSAQPPLAVPLMPVPHFGTLIR
jgi:hypothetical protein